MGDAVVEQKEFNAQLSEKIHTEKNSLDQRLDGLNNDFEHEWDNLQDSIEDLTDQQQCPPEEECQSGTMVEEPSYSSHKKAWWKILNPQLVLLYAYGGRRKQPSH